MKFRRAHFFGVALAAFAALASCDESPDKPLVGQEKFEARAKVAEPEAERERLYAAHAKVHPGFLDYVKKTTRKIPVVRLERIPSDAT